MSRSLIIASFFFALAIGLGCQSSEDNESGSKIRSVEDYWASELSAAETFTWDDQPISFAPPPLEWERQREQSGGLMGARFVLHESGGQSIHVAEVTKVGGRDRCSELKALNRDLDELNARDFQRRLQRARPYARDPINRSEKDAFETANNRLDDARTAFRAGDLEETRGRISAALWDLKFVQYSLEEVVGPALFTGERFGAIGKVEIFEPVAREVAGLAALALDYEVETRTAEKRLLHGRQIHFAHNNRLFEASFQGTEEYLPLFEAIVASITLPNGICEH